MSSRRPAWPFRFTLAVVLGYKPAFLGLLVGAGGMSVAYDFARDLFGGNISWFKGFLSERAKPIPHLARAGQPARVDEMSPK